MLKRARKEESGFTFAEVVVSVGVISLIMLMFGLMLLSSANLQKQIITTQNIDRLLAFETEQINSIKWDNLMNKPEVYAICNLDGIRISTQSVEPGPNLVSLDGTEASITRNVSWYSSGLPVECTDTNKNLFDAKIVTLTAAWLEDGEEKTKTVDVVRSRWAESPVDTSRPPQLADAIQLAYIDQLNTPLSWGQPYVYSGENSSPCLASSNTANSITVSINDSLGLCGINAINLEVGALYTVAVEITVLPDSSSLTLSHGDGIETTGLATADSGTAILTHTFYASQEEILVGIKVPSAETYLEGSQAIISDFRIYKN
jgi:competence protein ComGC